MPTIWTVVPTCLPTVLRRCHVCACGRFHASGKFRVNANHKLLDAWLLAHCAGCGDTVKLTVLERVGVRTVPPALLDRLHGNDPGLTAELLQQPELCRRNRVALDWAGAWRLDTGEAGPPDREVTEVWVRFAAPIPVRPVRVIAEGCGLSRGATERLVAAGRISSDARLDGRRSSGFSFTIRR